jgi:hypothetical protein
MHELSHYITIYPFNPYYELILSNTCSLLDKMSINISSAFANIFQPTIWRVNILIDLFIFSSPFNISTAIIFIKYFNYELKDLIVFINIWTEDFVNDFFVLFINFFKALMTCLYFTICCDFKGN